MAFSMFGEHIYAMGGVSDANGQPFESLQFNYDSFFDVREYFIWGEVGYVADEEEILYDNIHFTVWNQDEETVNGINPEGWGASFSATWRLKDQWWPFLRLGGSDGGGGAPDKAAVTVGTGIDMRNHDEFAIAANWSKPSTAGLRNSVTLETYYRFQLSQSIAIWPDLQVVFRPANNPNEDVLAVFSLTGRIAF
jgi:porin